MSQLQNAPRSVDVADELVSERLPYGCIDSTIRGVYQGKGDTDEHSSENSSEHRYPRVLRYGRPAEFEYQCAPRAHRRGAGCTGLAHGDADLQRYRPGRGCGSGFP